MVILINSTLIAGLVALVARLFFWHYQLRLVEEISIKRSELARQVSHDIRSPLSALNMIVTSLKELPEEKRLIIRNAAQRINDIANGLLQQSKGFEKKAQLGAVKSGTLANPIMLVALLDAIVSEKRIQFRERMEIDIQGDLNQGYGLFARVNPVEFARVISNLVNNSVEAMANGGRVNIAIRGYKDQVAVIVSDTGKGIPAEVLARLGERGVTHGKEGTQSGSGLGVYHAREMVEKAGGKLSIQSQVGMGTMITITLPRVETPPWFVEAITVSAHATLVSVDDDKTIHQIWAGRLSSAGAALANIQHLSFSSMDQFENWATDNGSSVALFLIDYEFLGQTGNGLDLIERAGIAKKAILVTSRYEEPQVRTQADSIGVKILPKTLAPFVPLKIETLHEKRDTWVGDDGNLNNQLIGTSSDPVNAAGENTKTRYDLCLIDDDTDLIHAVWASVASSKGLKIKMYSNSQEFMADAAMIDRRTPIYVDVSLGNGVSGIDVAHDIHKLGFTEINLATGYQAESMAIPPFIHRVVGKDFPEVG
jgi:anti-sigma regulatory factor (Ser/Thr protein kinase)